MSLNNPTGSLRATFFYIAIMRRIFCLWGGMEHCNLKLS